ncbi:MAG: DUF1289 domain-containing protein [Bacteroidales bacterium]
MEKIENPCIDICRYDEEEICIGCRRTLKEAKNWWRFTDNEKLKVLENIRERGAAGSSHLDFYV